jgi:hypothetical protein
LDETSHFIELSNGNLNELTSKSYYDINEDGAATDKDFNWLFIPCDYGSLNILSIDISNFSNPVTRQEWTVNHLSGAETEKLYWKNNVLYVAANCDNTSDIGGFSTVDVTDPVYPSTLDQIAPPYYCISLTGDESKAFVYDYEGSDYLYSLSVYDPSNISIKDKYQYSDRLYYLKIVKSNYLVASTKLGKLMIFDITNISDISIKGNISIGVTTRTRFEYDSANDYIIVAEDANGLKFYNFPY